MCDYAGMELSFTKHPHYYVMSDTELKELENRYFNETVDKYKLYYAEMVMKYQKTNMVQAAAAPAQKFPEAKVAGKFFNKPKTVPMPTYSGMSVDLVCIDEISLTTLSSGLSNNEDKKMSNTQTVTTPAQNHLIDRARTVRYDKLNTLPKLFNRDGDPEPKDAKEMIARIQAGQYTLDEKKIAAAQDESGRFFWDRGPLFGLEWRDPAKPFDKDGLNKAKKDVETAYTEVKDAIYVKDAETALKAVQEFESKTFH